MADTATPPATTETTTAAASTVETSKAESVKTDAKPDWVKDFLAPVPPNPAPATVEAKPEAKAEPKLAVKPETKEKSAVEKPEPVLSGVEKQLKDTRDYATRVNQQNVELGRQMTAMQQQLDILGKKLEGTYEEPKAPSAEEVRRQSSLVARVDASMAAAIEQFGQAEVEALITGAEAPWKELEKDPAINARVFASRLPVVEAMKVVKEQQTKAKYGGDLSKMKEVLTEELRESIRAELLKELRGNGAEEVKGLGGVPSGGRTEVKKGETTPEQHFASLFPSFKPTAG